MWTSVQQAAPTLQSRPAAADETGMSSEISAWASLLAASFALLGVAAALWIWTRERREGRRIEHVARVVESCRDFVREVDLASVELLPFWKDEVLREKFAGVAAEVEVHRHAQAALSGRAILAAYVDMAETRTSRSGNGNGLLASAGVVQAATMSLYHCLVPAESLTIERARGNFFGELDVLCERDGIPGLVALGEEISRKALDGPPVDAANYATRVLDQAQLALLQRLTDYVRCSGKSPLDSGPRRATR